MKNVERGRLEKLEKQVATLMAAQNELCHGRGESRVVRAVGAWIGWLLKHTHGTATPS